MVGRKSKPVTVHDIISRGPVPIACPSCGAANSFKGQSETRPYIACECRELIMLTDGVKAREIGATVARLG